MKLVIAQMKHETNTYSPVPTPLARFAVGGMPLEGAEPVLAQLQASVADHVGRLCHVFRNRRPVAGRVREGLVVRYGQYVTIGTAQYLMKGDI